LERSFHYFDPLSYYNISFNDLNVMSITIQHSDNYVESELLSVNPRHLVNSHEIEKLIIQTLDTKLIIQTLDTGENLFSVIRKLNKEGIRIDESELMYLYGDAAILNSIKSLHKQEYSQSKKWIKYAKTHFFKAFDMIIMSSKARDSLQMILNSQL